MSDHREIYDLHWVTDLKRDIHKQWGRVMPVQRELTEVQLKVLSVFNLQRRVTKI